MRLPDDICDYCERFWPRGGGDFIDAFGPVTPDSITIVTGFIDIGRGNWSGSRSETSTKFDRSVDRYFENFGRLAHVANDMIIFTTPDLAPRVLAAREAAGFAGRTIIYAIADFFECPAIRAVRRAISAQATPAFREFTWRPFVPEVNIPDYNLVTSLKPTFANTAIKFGVVRAPQLAWIDFGYAHTDGLLDAKVQWRYDAGNKINLFNIFKLDDKPIYDVVRGGEVYFAGCHIIGPVGAWPKFNRQFSDALNSLIQCSMMDDDQTLMLIAWRDEPESFTLRCYPTETDLGWRYVFRRYRTGVNSDIAPDALPEVRRDAKPAWMRDLSTSIRRRVRRWKRGLR